VSTTSTGGDRRGEEVAVDEGHGSLRAPLGHDLPRTERAQFGGSVLCTRSGSDDQGGFVLACADEVQPLYEVAAEGAGLLGRPQARPVVDVERDRDHGRAVDGVDERPSGRGGQACRDTADVQDPGILDDARRDVVGREPAAGAVLGDLLRRRGTPLLDHEPCGRVGVDAHVDLHSFGADLAVPSSARAWSGGHAPGLRLGGAP
jgi:hypothetical protein